MAPADSALCVEGDRRMIDQAGQTVSRLVGDLQNANIRLLSLHFANIIAWAREFADAHHCPPLDPPGEAALSEGEFVARCLVEGRDQVRLVAVGGRAGRLFRYGRSRSV